MATILLPPTTCVLVTGTRGSQWTTILYYSSEKFLFVGYEGSSNRLVISNGGAVMSELSWVKYLLSASWTSTPPTNSVLVTGDELSLDQRVQPSLSARSAVATTWSFPTAARWPFAAGFIGEHVPTPPTTACCVTHGGTWTNSGHEKKCRLPRQWQQLRCMSNVGSVVNSFGYIGGRVFFRFEQQRAGHRCGIAVDQRWHFSLSAKCGSSNSLVITDGGIVAFNTGGYIGTRTNASNNSVLVTGGAAHGPTATISIVGFQGSGNSLIISNGGEVFVGTNLVISAEAGASKNSVSISGGKLTVTNGQIDIGKAGSGALNVTGGTVTVKELLATNGTEQRDHLQRRHDHLRRHHGGQRSRLQDRRHRQRRHLHRQRRRA